MVQADDRKYGAEGQAGPYRYQAEANLYLCSNNAFSVYLRCDLATLRRRITKRGRPEEAHLDEAFLRRIQVNDLSYNSGEMSFSLQKCHEDWLFHKNHTMGPPPSPVIVIDASGSKEEFEALLRTKMDDIFAKAN